MATLAQIEANRRNAQLSTGPRTAEGKSASRQNALKTGIYAESQVVRGEDPAALAQLAAEYHDRWLPDTPEERALVDVLVNAEWTLRRLGVAESQLWEYELQSCLQPNEALPLGQAYARADHTFARLQRRIDATARLYRETLKELKQLHETRSAEAASPLPDPQTIEDAAQSPEIGFVPSTQASARLNCPGASFPGPRPLAPGPSQEVAA